VNKRHIHALGLVWFVTLSQATSAANPPIADTLHPPFDVAAARAHHGTAPTAFTCPAVPPPVRNLTFGGFYETDSGSSVVDTEAERRYKEAAKAVQRLPKENCQNERPIRRQQPTPVGGGEMRPSLARILGAGAGNPRQNVGPG